MQKQTIVIVAVIALIVGHASGYFIGKSYIRPQAGMHMMSNGQMMGNGGSMDMADMMMSMNAELRGKTGDAFDGAFLSEMIIHHQGAVEMAELALTNAKHQEIKDLARAIIAAQNKEITDMKSWQKAWYAQENTN